MARYRKLGQKIWADAKFRSLSAPAPNARDLFIWLIVGPATTNVPGVVLGTEAELAGRIGWSIDGFRSAFQEIQRAGMATADWEAGVVWLPNGPKYNRPESPNVVVNWRETWDVVPECRLKHAIYNRLKAFAEGLGEAFAEAYRRAIPIQEQEQEQEQELGGAADAAPDCERQHDPSPGQATPAPSAERPTAPAKPARAEDVPVPDPLNTPDFVKARDEWLAMRRRNRFPVRAEYVSKVYDRLTPLGPADAASCLSYSTDNVYQGVFPERVQRQKKPLVGAGQTYDPDARRRNPNYGKL